MHIRRQHSNGGRHAARAAGAESADRSQPEMPVVGEVALRSLEAKLAAALIFDNVPSADLSWLLGQTRVLVYRNGEEIFVRGAEGQFAFLVLAGLVRISTLGQNGKRVTVEIFKPPELFGELAIIDSQWRTADAAAMGSATLAAIPGGAIRDLLERSPAFAGNLLRLLARRLRRTYSLLEDASLMDLEHRLAKQVMYLMGIGAAGESRVRLYSRMRQGDLAELLGTTPRSIINILNKWRSEELAHFDGRTAQLTILDLSRFRRLAEGDT
jgi:CRP/FNR family cyclic AMP-dependent transcriptional regulator